MKSPGFQIRAQRLGKIFTLSRLKSAWKDDVRISAQRSHIRDIVDHFDFHVEQDRELKKLITAILDGRYSPSPPARILVEKSKGLCRQLVMPTLADRIVLQVLSSALYAALKDKAPTKNAYFLPEEHTFSAQGEKIEYGGFAAWLKFQKALFNFAKEREYIIVTDVANYYDSISYVHLRNVLSGLTGEAECVLDMLIFVLSGLLWQPDYMPRMEIGLPQIDMDAPRYLAHCFLFELDRHLRGKEETDFVRFMDDIDIGVDSIAAAKNTLKEIDLLLQTRQVRLNSGKTLILTKADAELHFCTQENQKLDILENAIKAKKKDNGEPDFAPERAALDLLFRDSLAANLFDKGNGEKVLKRVIRLSSAIRGKIPPGELQDFLTRRPGCRDGVLRYLVYSGPLNADTLIMLRKFIESGLVVDEAFYASLANLLVEARIAPGALADKALRALIAALPASQYYGIYSSLMLSSKFATAQELLNTTTSSADLWSQDHRLGRLVGGFLPRFTNNSALAGEFIDLVHSSRSEGASETFAFHDKLQMDEAVFKKMYAFLRSPNTSKPSGTTHPKFLCMISALNCAGAPDDMKTKIVGAHHRAWLDRHYLQIGTASGAIVAKGASISAPAKMSAGQKKKRASG